MKEQIADKIRDIHTEDAVLASEAGVNLDVNLSHDAKKRITDRTLRAAGLKKQSIGEIIMIKSFKWQKIAAIAACFCLVLCAVIITPKLINNGNGNEIDSGEENTGATPPSPPSGIIGEFVGLHLFKSFASAYEDGTVFTVEVSVNLDLDVDVQRACFEDQGMKTFYDDGRMFVEMTKDQTQSLTLPENMQFTHFHISNENIDF